jgi:methylase of polypeptide subunit release factors
VYVDKSKDFKGYSKLIFDPVKVFNPPYLTGTSLPPEELFKMRNDMFATLTGAFKSGYEVVDKPGPDVLKVSVSVTGVQMVKPDWKLGDNIPVKKAIDLFTGGKVVPLMSAEMEVLDAKGNIVAAASAMRKGEKELFKDDKLNWDHLQPVVSYWANGLRLGLDQLRVNADRVNPAE